MPYPAFPRLTEVDPWLPVVTSVYASGGSASPVDLSDADLLAQYSTQITPLPVGSGSTQRLGAAGPTGQVWLVGTGSNQRVGVAGPAGLACLVGSGSTERVGVAGPAGQACLVGTGTCPFGAVCSRQPSPCRSRHGMACAGRLRTCTVCACHLSKQAPFQMGASRKRCRASAGMEVYTVERSGACIGKARCMAVRAMAQPAIARRVTTFGHPAPRSSFPAVPVWTVRQLCAVPA